ncbi:MAG: AAA family ATPase [Caldilineaceae bacterium]
MSQLSICLFGPPTLTIDGRQVLLDRWKAVALLAYLAVEERPHRRDGLATLFWPELSQAKARNGLRRSLHALKQALGDDWLDAGREIVELRRTPNLTIDVWRFSALLKPQARTAGPVAIPMAALREAVALYRDDFLAEFSLRDAPAFEDWRYFTAEELRREMTRAADALLRAQREAGDLGAALQTARRRLALDPLEENAHRTLIELHLAAGDRAAALRQYEHCAQLLAQELGVEPDAATQALLESSPNKPRPASPAAAVPPKRAPLARTFPSPVGWTASGPNEGGPVDSGSADGTSAKSGLSRNSQPCEEAIRQVVVLNVAIVGWPPGIQRRQQQEQLDRFLTGATAALQRYAAHVDHLGPDGVVAYFGVPHSHEDDAERALHMAFALQSAAQRAGIVLAAGIKIGPALVAWRELEGRSETQEVFGAVLGQAAELQRAAAEGQILVDRATYLQTHSSSFCTVQVRLRGQETAACVYLAVAELPLRKTRGIPGLQAELVGRTAELTVLEKAIDGLASGAGQVLLLSGEAGIGKSRLVAEARARRREQALWLEGRCLEMTTAASYGLFLDALRDYFGWQLDTDEAAQAGAMREGLARLAAAQMWDDDTCAEIGAVLGRLYAVHFGTHMASGWDDRLANAAPAELRHRTQTALRTLLAAIARQQPLVLVLEDLHWADDASLDLINELLSCAGAEALLLICVYRPVLEARCAQLPVLAARKCPAHYQELRLRELTPAESAQMVTALLEVEALAPPTKSWILERAQGNPYFTEESIFGLIEAGLIRRDGHVWRTTDPRAGAPADLELPFSVDQLIAARVDRLPAALRHTLEAAAVLGRTFALPLLRGMAADGGNTAGQPPGQDNGQLEKPLDEKVEKQIEELEQRSFLYCERAEPLAEFSFRHVLLQVAIYQMLPDGRRSALHLHAAHAMERLYADNLDAHVDALAYHYARTSDLRRAIDYLLKAGAAARGVFANEAAVAYFQGALDRLSQLDAEGEGTVHATWREAWHQLGRTYYAMGRYELAEAAFGEAIAHAQAAGAPPPAIVRLLYWRGEALYWEDKHAEVVANARAGLALLSPAAPCRETVLMLSHLVAGMLALEDEEQYDAYVRQLRPLVRTFPFVEELSSAYFQVAAHYKRQGNAAAAAEWIECLRVAAAARQDMTSLAKARALHGILLSQQCDFGCAAQVLQETLALSRRIGETTMIYFSLSRLAIQAVVQGELAAACEYADQLLYVGDPQNPPIASLRAECGYLYLAAGRCEEAIGLLSRGPGDHEEAAIFDSAEARFYRARALEAAKRADEAAQLHQLVLTGCGPASPPFLTYPETKPAYWGAVAALDRLMTDPLTFRALCDAQRARWPGDGAACPYSWYATEIQPRHGGGIEEGGEITPELLAQWEWCDPFQDGACHFEHCATPGVELVAADGRDLWYLNTGAPSLRTGVAGDFALQARCGVSARRPRAMGGLLLWCDGSNYVRLDWGGLGVGEISFLGWAGGKRRFWGRARSGCGQPILRLERSDQEVRALFSEDGRGWLLVGQTALAVDGPWSAGLLGLGMVDRTLVPGAPPGGAAIRFDSIKFWRE